MNKFNTKSIHMVLALLSVLFLSESACYSETTYKISQFISPDTCGGCHSEIFSQWENSMHNLSQKDPIYLSLSEFLLKGLTDKDELLEAQSCVKCHVPVGFVTGYPLKTSDDREKIDELSIQGIQCDYCHSVTGAKKMFNNGLILSPGNGEEDPGIKRGPYKDSESDFHETAYSEFHTSSKICGTCHNVKHVVFNTPLESTYDEWEKGPYYSSNPEKNVTCQDCHMYQRPGIPATGSTPRPPNKGYASDDGPIRDHVFTHYFVGGNKQVPGLFGDKGKLKMAEERLRNAAHLSINDHLASKQSLKIKITNSGAGHYLPTGLTDIRQMWLEINIENENQKIIYSSGQLDSNGYLPQDAIIFNTVYGDGKGNPVVNISKAREILKDKRIPPLESVYETITLPQGKWKHLTVKVKLLYRSAPQKLLDQVSGKGKITMPVTTMAELSKRITM